MRTINERISKDLKNCYFCDYYGYWVTKEMCLNRYKKGKKFCIKKCKDLIILIEKENAD
jgi:hypothetical protein